MNADTPRDRARIPTLVRFAALIGVVAAVAVIALLTAPGERKVERPLTLLISGDTGGWITPCGCTANQSGGLARRATLADNLRTRSDVLLADVGGAVAGNSRYDEVKLEAILRGEQLMGVAVHNIGKAEAGFSPDFLRETAAKTKTRFLSANLRDANGSPIAEPLVILPAGGQRIAFVGVLSPALAPKSLTVAPPREAILQAIGPAKGTYDTLIVLAYLPEDELRTLAEELPEADLVVGGPTGQSIAPVRRGATLLASSTSKGKFLAQFECAAKGQPWTGSIVEIDGRYPDQPNQETNLAAFRQTLGDLDLSASQTAHAPARLAGAPANYRVAGNAACKRCHVQDCVGWEQSKHSAAWTNLKEHHSDVDSYCQQCHVTGFGLPGGFVSRLQSPSLTAVGCESCHGPSSAHAAQPSLRTPFIARDQCTKCHDPENSPKFAYDEYWKKIPHGVKVPPSAASAANLSNGTQP